MAQNIWRCDAASVNYVQACKEISTLWHMIEICVLNSLQAHARDIHIELDLGIGQSSLEGYGSRQSMFSVSDSGCGIRESEFVLIGSCVKGDRSLNESHESFGSSDHGDTPSNCRTGERTSAA